MRFRTAATATGMLQDAGFAVTTTSRKACVAPGTVITQSPSAGTVAVPGSSVHITVDSGTEKSCGVIK